MERSRPYRGHHRSYRYRSNRHHSLPYRDRQWHPRRRWYDPSYRYKVYKRRFSYWHFQNSNAKYSAKPNYERERMRERDSPNGNSYRSESPDCDSPRDRGGYHSKSSIYMSKSRDYKRDKYAVTVLDKHSSNSRSAVGNNGKPSGASSAPVNVRVDKLAAASSGYWPQHHDSASDPRKQEINSSVVSPPSNLSSLQTLSAGSTLAAIRPQAPNLTPSLANFYRDDLVNHVRGWQADLLEKQPTSTNPRLPICCDRWHLHLCNRNKNLTCLFVN
ncbi:unnamed protein product [Nesidiocoris tenuis]|uniref:Uncharacterized protein n=1 Tax=Nesidiocoris tenuis TaxID=355587 RepID=A0A6H5G1Y7_9HEMI|nr:unnamed protein product [Nesidiocoris tenuis]